MATVTYTASFSDELLFSSHPSATLSGPSSTIPDDAVINSITFSVYCGVSTYNYTADTVMTLTDGNGSSTTISSTCYTGSANRLWATFGGAPNNTLDWNDLETIELSGTNKLTVRTGYTATLTIDYIVYTRCSAPTEVKLSAENAAPGAGVTLSWSGAAPGENNPIAGYEVARSVGDSEEYSRLTTVSSTATYGSTTVTAPTTNGETYHYKVLTLGSKSGYDSSASVVSATLTCAYSAISAPTKVWLEVTNAAPEAEVTLNWSGASAGTNNAIVGYEIYRSEGETGDYTLLTTITTSETTGSATVAAPANDGEYYTFKVMAKGTLTGYDGAMSSASATLSCTFSAPTAPKTVTVEGGTSVYATPGETVSLAWSGASAGANNPITGYDIYRNGELLETGLTASTTRFDVTAHETAGNAYSYAVLTKGAYSDSTMSSTCTVYSYSDPTAPTEVVVSDSNPSAGARVVLSWSGAIAGGYNAITGYRVYRATEVNGNYTLVATVSSTSESGSCTVDAPFTSGDIYYYCVETAGEHSNSGQSEAYASVTAGETSAGEDSDITVIITPKPRKKRGFIFGDYDTATDGLWTLTGWSFPEPEHQSNYLDVPGRSAGPLDLSTVLTNGDPRYNSRELSATFECSEGTREDRNEIISLMTNKLNGQRVDIVLPDDPTRYAVGRLRVTTEYSDMAHASVSVTGVCDPWRYNKEETRQEVQLLGASQEIVLSNSGRKVLSPEITVTGYGADVTINCNGGSWSLNEGTYHLSGLTLSHGDTLVTCSGLGTVAFAYREAIL